MRAVLAGAGRRTPAVLATGLLAAVAVAGAILFFQARDDSTIDPPMATGLRYGGEPVLSPALEEAVAAGNVVVLHRDARVPDGTRSLQEGAPPELEPEGLAVLLEREPTLRAPLAAVSVNRIQYAERPSQLQEFVDFHLGRAGAP